MKTVFIALNFLICMPVFSQDYVNSLIRSGKYDEALKAIQDTEGAESKKFDDLKQWMSQGYSANLNKSDTDIQPQGYRITLVSGFNKCWMVAMNKGAFNTRAEVYNGPGMWPKEWIEKKWKEGYQISQVAGDINGWVVVMNKGTPYTAQKYFGPGPFPEKGIGDTALEGYRITSVAGYQNHWVVVVSKGTRFGGQRFTTPSDFAAKRDWIRTRWNEGYQITHLAGDNVSQGENTYVIVMTLNSGIDGQHYIGPSEFPFDWIKQKYDSGYFITAATGHKNWIVVMSKGFLNPGQSYRVSEDFPETFIKSKW